MECTNVYVEQRMKGRYITERLNKLTNIYSMYELQFYLYFMHNAFNLKIA